MHVSNIFGMPVLKCVIVVVVVIYRFVKRNVAFGVLYDQSLIMCRIWSEYLRAKYVRVCVALRRETHRKLNTKKLYKLDKHAHVCCMYVYRIRLCLRMLWAHKIHEIVWHMQNSPISRIVRAVCGLVGVFDMGGCCVGFFVYDVRVSSTCCAYFLDFVRAKIAKNLFFFSNIFTFSYLTLICVVVVGGSEACGCVWCREEEHMCGAWNSCAKLFYPYSGVLFVCVCGMKPMMSRCYSNALIWFAIKTFSVNS